MNELNEGKCDLPDDPIFGFKRDLVRLIGNLAYRNKEVQDQVRNIFC